MSISLYVQVETCSTLHLHASLSSIPNQLAAPVLSYTEMIDLLLYGFPRFILSAIGKSMGTAAVVEGIWYAGNEIEL